MRMATHCERGIQILFFELISHNSDTENLQLVMNGLNRVLGPSICMSGRMYSLWFWTTVPDDQGAGACGKKQLACRSGQRITTRHDFDTIAINIHAQKSVRLMPNESYTCRHSQMCLDACSAGENAKHRCVQRSCQKVVQHSGARKMDEGREEREEKSQTY